MRLNFYPLIQTEIEAKNKKNNNKKQNKRVTTTTNTISGEFLKKYKIRNFQNSFELIFLAT